MAMMTRSWADVVAILSVHTCMHVPAWHPFKQEVLVDVRGSNCGPLVDAYFLEYIPEMHHAWLA
jgi:hypothetical protein